MTKKNIVVLGSGNFGTAVANYISQDLGYNVTLYTRSKEYAKGINDTKENKRHLPGITLNNRLTAKSELSDIIPQADILIFAVPAQQFRNLLKKIREYVRQDTIFLNLAKGIEQKSGKLLSRVMVEECGHEKLSKYAMLSGPSFAQDIVSKRPIGVTISGKRKNTIIQLQNINELERIFCN